MDNREEFLMKNSLDGGLFQSEGWEKFQKKLGKNSWFIESDKNKALIIENKLPIVGSYFYVARGPVFSSNEKDNLMLAKKIREKAQENKIGWIRVEPQRKEDLKYFEGLVFKSKKNHQPAETIRIDLNQKEEAILKSMKQKTRYNIKLAEKKGVKIKIAKNIKEVDIFWNLVQETAKRDGVNFHKKDYYEKMFESFSKDNLELILAQKKDEVIGGVLISYFGGVASYLHGASSNKSRDLMANYLLQWEAIKRAKEKGIKQYDFFGIAVNENQKKWAGITRFKKGFCPKGEPVIFPGCWDIVLSPGRYLLYRIIQMIK